MASIVNDKNGRKRIQIQRRDGKRGTVRLGKVSSRAAEKILTQVRSLETAALSGTTPDPMATQWLSTIGDTLHRRVADNLLCSPRAGRDTSKRKAIDEAFATLAKEMGLWDDHAEALKADTGLSPGQQTAKDGLERDKCVALAEAGLNPFTVGILVDAFTKRRTDVKSQTKLVWRQARTHLCRIIGVDREIVAVTPADADDFRRKLRSAYSEAFTAKMVMVAKAVFREAVRRRLLAESPFLTVRNGSQRNPARQHYVERAIIERVMEQATDPEWRAMIALARFAGLRVPSEPLALTWDDVDFGQGRMTVRAAKTAHHEGKGIRVIPLFPEVEPHLLKLLDQAEEGDAHVFKRLRRTNANLRTTFTKYVTRAGYTPWPRLFNALRASCATDLAAKHPGHVAAAWMGHSETVAQAHYWKVTDADFEAVREGGKKATLNPTLQTAEMGGNARQRASEIASLSPEKQKTPEIPGFLVGDEGFEPPTLSV